MCTFASNSHATHISPSERNILVPSIHRCIPKRQVRMQKHNPNTIPCSLNSNRHNTTTYYSTSNLQAICKKVAKSNLQSPMHHKSKIEDGPIYQPKHLTYNLSSNVGVSKYIFASNSHPKHKNMSRRKYWERENWTYFCSRWLMRRMESGREIEEMNLKFELNFCGCWRRWMKGEVMLLLLLLL